MSISDAVKLRYSVSHLAGLTSQNDPNATDINQAVLDAAISDIEGEFLSRGALTLDDTNKEHVNLAVFGVVALLEHRNAQGGGNYAELERFRADLDRLAASSSRKRVTPSTRSTRRTTEDSQPMAPYFDDRRFDWSRPNPPRSGRDAGDE